MLPVFRRSTGDGPVSGPPFSRGCGSRPRTHVTSRVRRPRSAPRAGLGAAGRRPLPSATGPDAASKSAPIRTPAPSAGVARLCRCRGRTECPAGRAGPTPAAARATAPATAAATVRSEPTTHRPRSTVEYPHLTNGRIITPVTAYQAVSARSCYELNGSWKPISVDGVELFDMAAVPVTRYRYRGNKIPNPWVPA